jgi:anti-sigma B factor antagonist
VQVELRFEEPGEFLLIHAEGTELGADSADAVRTALLARISANPWVILDLSEVTFMDSSGLGVLVSAMKAVRSHGELRLIGVHPRVREVFTLTGLSRVFTVDEDLALATAALEKAKGKAKIA